MSHQQRRRNGGIRPTVLIGDDPRSETARHLRRQTYFGEEVATPYLGSDGTGGGDVVGTAAASRGRLSPDTGSHRRPPMRLKGDALWMQSARSGRPYGSALCCPGCGTRFFSGTMSGIHTSRGMCGLCSARLDRRRAGLHGMAGGKVDTAWRRRLRPTTQEEQLNAAVAGGGVGAHGPRLGQGLCAPTTQPPHAQPQRQWQDNQHSPPEPQQLSGRSQARPVSGSPVAAAAASSSTWRRRRRRRRRHSVAERSGDGGARHHQAHGGAAAAAAPRGLRPSSAAAAAAAATDGPEDAASQHHPSNHSWRGDSSSGAPKALVGGAGRPVGSPSQGVRQSVCPEGVHAPASEREARWARRAAERRSRAPGRRNGRRRLAASASAPLWQARSVTQRG
jgi:hypothetical protein